MVNFSYLCSRKSGCRNGGMVDTRDLKSLGHYGCVGSSPTFGTINITSDANGVACFYDQNLE